MNENRPIPLTEPDPIAEVARLAEVVFKFDESLFGRPANKPPQAAQPEPAGDMPGGVIAAERELFLWEMCQELQRIRCRVIAKCADLRCRRRKRCSGLDEISPKIEAARTRLAAERAKRQRAPDEPACGRKKGRTRVRP